MRYGFLLLITLYFAASDAFGQPESVRKVGQFAGAGIVENIQPGEITIRRSDGKQKSFLIQNKDERYLSLDGNELIVPMPSRINVFGSLPGSLLEKGMVLKFRGEINRAGRTGKPVTEIQVISGDQSSVSIKPVRMPTGKEMVPCDFIGIVQAMANNSVYLVVPRSRLTPNERVTVKIADDAFFDIRADDLNRVQQGDKVVLFRGDTLENGKMVIRDIRVELSPKRKVTTLSYTDRLYLKHSKLPDVLLPPREEHSDHFVLHTDISKRSSRVLLEKLETMHRFLSRYYGVKPNAIIECYVVSDPENFTRAVPRYALNKIRARSGLTQYRSRNGAPGKRPRTVATVYSCDDQNIVQHEAVHAFCSIAFGSVGPVWYAEGMAELGQYFVPGEEAIQIEPVIVEYLKEAKVKDIETIVQANQITGDSWKAYAWRWALCQLLANHPDYSKRFRELGKNLMLEKKDSFGKAFGKQIERIKFEYQQFLEHLDNGYRPDLCRWQWTTDVTALNKRVSFLVDSRSGWQATGIYLDDDQDYDFACPNSIAKQQQGWVVDGSRRKVGPNGNARGDGKLIGAVFTDYELSDPFEIGSRLSGFRPARSGQLYVRCQEAMNAIADNEGAIRFYIRKSPDKSIE